MWKLLFVVGFILFFINEIQIGLKGKSSGSQLFFIGTLFLVLSTAAEFITSGFTVQNVFKQSPVWAILFMGAFMLLVYTLFFAVDFKQSYLQDTNKRVCDSGVYALCRHPGVLWFFFLYYGLYQILPSADMLFFFIVGNGLNLAYAIVQDRWTFPKTFVDYSRYKRTTPFLIPNWNSIKNTFETKEGR
ncbi:MAG TPA: hypothetical protein DHN33_05315 [Eubacteriaceae bacterium]|nr:hypothetical protein [Eubacteriaceae bacterium]